MCEQSPQTFSHENKKEGREWISLSDTLRRVESSRGDTIDENKEERNGNEAENPTYPGVIKPKSKENLFNESPISLSKALERSSLRSIPIFFESLRECMNSWARMIKLRI